MKLKNVWLITTGVLLGVLLAWLLGLFNQTQTKAADKVAPSLATGKALAVPPKPVNPHSLVAAPVLPPVAVSQTAPATPKPVGSVDSTSAQTAAFDQVRHQSQIKAMTNNLRMLSTAASQFMLDKGVTSASYFDLVGFGTDNYIRSVNPVMGEDYTGFFISQTDTQTTVVAPDGTSVTFNL